MSFATNRLPLALLTAALLLAAGCVSAPVDRYYVLDGRPSTDGFTDRDTLPLRLKVRTFDAAEVLRQERILRRTSEQEVSYYDTHRWAAPIERMVTERTVAWLRARLPLREVQEWTAPGTPDLMLYGHVLRFEETSVDGPGREAHVRLDLRLRDWRSPDRPLLWNQTVERICPVVGGGGGAAARALDACLDRVLEEAAGHMSRALPESPEAGT